MRRGDSGREILRYIILTRAGEVDCGLTFSFVNKNHELKIRLDCYDMSYYKGIDNNFSLPENIDLYYGKPVVRVSGLIKTNDFPVS